MKIAILGYGRMGKMVEAQAIERGHQVGARIGQDEIDLDAAVVRISRHGHRLASMPWPLDRGEALNPQIGHYLNRLGDLLFALARGANRSAGVSDVPWTPAPVEAKGWENSVGSLTILEPDAFKESFTLPEGYVIDGGPDLGGGGIRVFSQYSGLITAPCTDFQYNILGR